MKIQKNQHGFSVIEALIIIVILAIIGFAGYFVYHGKQAADKTDNSTAKVSQTASSQTAEDSDMAQVTVPASVNVLLKYPESWKVVYNQGYYAAQIIGPGKDVFVYVEALGGLGGHCDPSESYVGTISLVRAQPLNNPMFSLVTYSEKGGSTPGRVVSEVVPTTDIDHFKDGASVCDGYLNQILDERVLGKRQTKDINVESTVIGIQSKGILALESAGKTPTGQDVQSFLSSADFKAAVNIVKSFTY